MQVGRYELLAEIGRGGASVVYRARSPQGREVALKLLGRERKDGLARFERERRLLAELGEGEGFVPLLDAGDSPQGPWLVMPFLAGGTLRDKLSRGALGIGETVELGSRLAKAIGRAHARGIVHRDLKPENVLFTERGVPLVADLGLAKHFLRDAPGAGLSVALSRSGETRGTAGYMSPEQMSDASAAGAPADVFAIGAILYECLAGEPAFEGENVVALMARVASSRTDPLRSRRPGTPRWLDLVIARALAKDPGKRFPDGEALARALEEGKRAARSGRLALAVLAWLAIVVVSLASYIFVSGGGSREPPPPPPPVSSSSPSSKTAERADPRLLGTSLGRRHPEVPPDEDTELFLATAQRDAAFSLERRGRAEEALAAWRRVQDSTDAPGPLRREAVEHVRALLPKVPPNADPALASTFRMKVLVFTRTEFAWTDAAGERHEASLTMSDAERRDVRTAVASLAAKVLEFTRGWLRLETDIELVREPVSDLQETNGLYFPYDWNLAKVYRFADDLPRDRYDAVLAYVLAAGEGSAIPRSVDAYATENGPEGAGFMVFAATPDELHGTDGERELNVFLQMMRAIFDVGQGWPVEAFPSPNDGRDEGTDPREGDPCYRRPRGESDWFGYYRHLMTEHATERMWRAASTRRWTKNPWNAACVHKWRVSDPLPFDGEPGAGLALATPLDGLDALPKKGTRIVETPGRPLYLDRVFPETNGRFVSFCQVWARVRSAGEARLLFGSDDGARVSVNGGVVYEDSKPRSLRVDENSIPVRLREGWNRIVVKVENDMGAWGCALSIRDGKGAPLDEVELSPDGPSPAGSH